MEYTDHYAIAKHGPFGEGEALSAYSIVNVAMDTIDDILWEHKGLIDALEARMASAETRLTNLESRMSTAESNITRIDQNIDEIEQNITRIDQNIDEIEQNITRIDQNIDEIEQNIDQVEQNITQIQQEMQESDTAIWNAINNILSKVNGSNSVDEDDGDITWGVTGNIAVGNINLYSGTGYIRTTPNTSSSPGSNDVRVQ